MTNDFWVLMLVPIMVTIGALLLQYARVFDDD